MSVDSFDLAILRALQKNSSQTNSELSNTVNLSASQISRRRAALEKSGLIAGYSARLNATGLGFGFRAITRVNLKSHGENSAHTFADFLQRQPAVRAAWSVSGDADYVLEIHARDLAGFAEFIHSDLLPHPQVAQVRSEIVLTTIKEDRGLPI